tara:strand:- start:390 stop:1307 length:918 start_codon:yes stop_codon:yes gene_type:complete
MKSFNQFVVESYTARENIMEVLPLVAAAVPAALKLGSLALGAYSAYSAAKNLKKGNYKGAALDALGMVPGGAVFKGAKLLGAGRNVARAASTTQSVVRNFSPNARNRAISKGIDMGAAALGLGSGTTQMANKDKAPAAPKDNTVASQTPPSTNTNTSRASRGVVTVNKDGTYSQGGKKLNIGKSAATAAGNTAKKVLGTGRSDLGGGQTDGRITAMAGKGAVRSSKPGGVGGVVGGAVVKGNNKTSEAPKSTENTAVGTTAKKASDEKSKGDNVKTAMNPDSSLRVTQRRDPKKTAKIKQALTLS